MSHEVLLKREDRMSEKNEINEDSFLNNPETNISYNASTLSNTKVYPI